MVRWGEGGSRTLIGLPLQLTENLLREAGAGDILLASSAHRELEPALGRAQVEVPPQRGLLSTQSIYLLDVTAAARVAAVTGRRVTHPSGVDGEDPEPSFSLAAIEPGALLGARFEILSVLGAGGMGRDYKARDRDLGDLVALKLLRPDVARDRALVDGLQAELARVRRIVHPNVLRIFDFGEIDGVPFISMEYVRGITLSRMLEQLSDRLPYAAALRVARQLLAGLAAAHAMDVLHGDIKPENVLLDLTGNLKLTDFGLTRAAPEPLEGAAASPRSDVYAGGLLLDELFMDRPPELENLIQRCLEKDPAARPPDAGAMLAELERLGR